jgi:hypothetical protein
VRTISASIEFQLSEPSFLPSMLHSIGSNTDVLFCAEAAEKRLDGACVSKMYLLSVTVSQYTVLFSELCTMQ